MRGLFISPTLQNLGGIVILLVFVAVISQATGEECDRDDTCWYLQPKVTVVRERSWWCLWIWKCGTYDVKIGTEKVCHCCPGSQGDVSNCQHCPEGNFGYNCEEACECPNTTDTQCDPHNGACYGGITSAVGPAMVHNCSGECIKGQECHNNTCVCPQGWSGEKCDLHSRCPDGLYGSSCEHKCQCNNGTSQCHDFTGQCSCYPGWVGPACNETCPPSHYGENCSMECHCPMNASRCDSVSGDCLCPAGFYGKSCSTECPDGRFGPSCQSPCKCDNSTEICNSINGTCTAKDDPDVNDKPLPSSLAGPVVGAIVASVLLAALLVILILFLIRTSKQAKQSRDTHIVKVSELAVNPCYENPIDIAPDMGASDHAPLQHFVVGGDTYAVHDNGTQDSPSCKAEAVRGFDEYSYSHVQPTSCGDRGFNPHHHDEQNDYSHLTRDDVRPLHSSRPPPPDSSEEARYADTTRVLRSKAKEYDNLERGVKQPGGVKDTQYEVVIKK